MCHWHSKEQFVILPVQWRFLHCQCTFFFASTTTAWEEQWATSSLGQMTTTNSNRLNSHQSMLMQRQASLTTWWMWFTWTRSDFTWTRLKRNIACTRTNQILRGSARTKTSQQRWCSWLLLQDWVSITATIDGQMVCLAFGPLSFRKRLSKPARTEQRGCLRQRASLLEQRNTWRWCLKKIFLWQWRNGQLQRRNKRSTSSRIMPGPTRSPLTGKLGRLLLWRVGISKSRDNLQDHQTIWNNTWESIVIGHSTLIARCATIWQRSKWFF